jgi:hypothetical protein
VRSCLEESGNWPGGVLSNLSADPKVRGLGPHGTFRWCCLAPFSDSLRSSSLSSQVDCRRTPRRTTPQRPERISSARRSHAKVRLGVLSLQVLTLRVFGERKEALSKPRRLYTIQFSPLLLHVLKHQRVPSYTRAKLSGGSRGSHCTHSTEVSLGLQATRALPVVTTIIFKEGNHIHRRWKVFFWLQGSLRLCLPLPNLHTAESQGRPSTRQCTLGVETMISKHKI